MTTSRWVRAILFLAAVLARSKAFTPHTALGSRALVVARTASGAINACAISARPHALTPLGAATVGAGGSVGGGSDTMDGDGDGCTSLHGRVERLHLSARKAIKHRHADWAGSFYDWSLKQWRAQLDRGDLARTYLLAALNEQRLGRHSDARVVFMRGTAECQSAKLLVTWSLFESKQGCMDRALALARRAVVLDPSLAPVLRWKMFVDAAAAQEAARSGGGATPPSSGDRRRRRSVRNSRR